MYRSGLIALLLVLMLAAVSVLFPSQRAAAQTETTPTPTVTPTPSDSFRVALSSGAELVVERRISYGEIAVVTVMGVFLVGVAIYGIVRLVRLWLY